MASGGLWPRLLGALLALGCWLPLTASAEPEPGAQPTQLEILVSPGVHSSGRPVNAELLLRGSDADVLEITRVDFVLEPGHFVCDEESPGAAPETERPATDGQAAGRRIDAAAVASWEPATALVLERGTSQRRFVSIPSRLSRCVFAWPNPSSLVRLLGMSSGTFNVRAEAVLAGEGPRITGQTSIRFDVPFRVVFLGALVGNLLVTALLALLGVARSIDGNRPAWKAIARELLVHAGIRLPIGFTTATIALVLARASLDVPGLVSVEVNDFLGGVIVGLFAQAASRPIAERLTGARMPDGGADAAPAPEAP